MSAFGLGGRRSRERHPGARSCTRARATARGRRRRRARAPGEREDGRERDERERPSQFHEAARRPASLGVPADVVGGTRHGPSRRAKQHRLARGRAPPPTGRRARRAALVHRCSAATFSSSALVPPKTPRPEARRASDAVAHARNLPRARHEAQRERGASRPARIQAADPVARRRRRCGLRRSPRDARSVHAELGERSRDERATRRGGRGRVPPARGVADRPPIPTGDGTRSSHCAQQTAADDHARPPKSRANARARAATRARPPPGRARWSTRAPPPSARAAIGTVGTRATNAGAHGARRGSARRARASASCSAGERLSRHPRPHRAANDERGLPLERRGRRGRGGRGGRVRTHLRRSKTPRCAWVLEPSLRDVSRDEPLAGHPARGSREPGERAPALSGLERAVAERLRRETCRRPRRRQTVARVRFSRRAPRPLAAASAVAAAAAEHDQRLEAVAGGSTPRRRAARRPASPDARAAAAAARGEARRRRRARARRRSAATRRVEATARVRAGEAERRARRRPRSRAHAAGKLQKGIGDGFGARNVP